MGIIDRIIFEIKGGKSYFRIGYLERKMNGSHQISFDGGSHWYGDERLYRNKISFEQTIAEKYKEGSARWWDTVFKEHYGGTSSFYWDKNFPYHDQYINYDLVSIDGGNIWLALDEKGVVMGYADDIYPGLVEYLNNYPSLLGKRMGGAFIAEAVCGRKDRGSWQLRERVK